MLGMTFALPHRLRNSNVAPGTLDEGGVTVKAYTFPSEYANDPTMDTRVREALNLAIDKRAISAGPHFGFSHPSGSIYSAGTFGSRDEVVHNPSPYDPERARALLAEAGYPNGFEIQGHFGQFAGRPGIPEAADAIASYWKDIGVTVSWQEHDPSDFVKGFRAGNLSWTQVSLPTFGRQEHGARRVISSYHSTGSYQHPHTAEVTALKFKLLNTIDVDEQQRLLAEIEDKVLALKEIFPLYGMSLVMGYTDRVLAHPTVEHSPHFKHIDLIVLRD
ncbi:MAG: ABC transporter substrate-binding protein, partial [Dehalococcoidia bacterium]